MRRGLETASGVQVAGTNNFRRYNASRERIEGASLYVALSPRADSPRAEPMGSRKRGLISSTEQRSVPITIRRTVQVEDIDGSGCPKGKQLTRARSRTPLATRKEYRTLEAYQLRKEPPSRSRMLRVSGCLKDTQFTCSRPHTPLAARLYNEYGTLNLLV
jgi:hypothetical protein